MWLARDRFGLHLFKDKPERFPNNVFDYSDHTKKITDKLTINPDLYPEITFDNSPVECEIKLK